MPILLFGQQGSLSTEEIEQYKIQVKELVSYVEGTLNFIGDPENVNREKEIVINESYLKVFKDDEVQVEDDLDESREVPLHKDVQAYLKDIEFFFQSVRFQFIISDITFNANSDNLYYFKVTLNRDLTGITVDGDSVSNKKVRFMEINLDPGSNDMRIASLYTTKLNEREEMRNWWNGLPEAWRTVFGGHTVVYDSIRLSEVYFIADSLILLGKSDSVKNVTDTSAYFNLELPPQRELSSSTTYDTVYVNTAILFNKLSGLVKQTVVDVSGNEQIRSLEPLSELSGLVELNCSNTLVSDLFPLRNLNRLEVLDLSNTPVNDITALQYSSSLKQIYCGFSLLNDLSPIAGLYKLEKLSCQGLRIDQTSFLAGLTGLVELDLSETRIPNLSDLAELDKLEELTVSETAIRSLDQVSSFPRLRYLNAEHTSVTTLEPLTGLEKLEVLKISNTGIASLKPVHGISTLKRIYWDGSGEFSLDNKVKRAEAIDFMNSHPGSLVIFESEELMNSWAKLEEPWKQYARSKVTLSDVPTKEELHGLLQIEEIRIDSLPITTLNPVANLYKLRKLSVPGLQVDAYDPIGEALELEYLDLSYTSVRSIEFASTLKNLKELHIEGTAVASFDGLEDLKELKIIYADETDIQVEEVLALRKLNAGCVVIFKTAELEGWWKSLPAAWRQFFTTNFKLDSPPTREQLHQLLYLEEIEINDHRDIQSFAPLSQLINLKIARFSKLNVGDLQYMASFSGLTELHCSEMPVSDLQPLSGLSELQVLNLENAPVSDLKPLAALIQLRELTISGTQVKSLKPLSGLRKLEVLKLNNTPVKSISPLFDLPVIQSLSCFNTKISEKNIEKFKEQKPGCKVVYY